MVKDQTDKTINELFFISSDHEDNPYKVAFIISGQSPEAIIKALEEYIKEIKSFGRPLEGTRINSSIRATQVALRLGIWSNG